MCVVVIFFFKRRTAYEMRISDWSSDVCSSDLHAAGDFALMEIAKRLAASIRATDVAARIGGDEFGLILDQSSEDGARAQVTRLCDVLTAAPAHYDGPEIALSACFGVAMLRTGLNESHILAAADRDR